MSIIFRITFISLIASVFFVMHEPLVCAEGLLLRMEQIPTFERNQLKKQIQAARKKHPAIFKAVEHIQDRAAILDATKKGRFAAISPKFKALGREALLPMINMLAFSARPRGHISSKAWTALRAGLLEAVGDLRDPLARPVLIAILESNTTDLNIIRAAAEALGKLGEDQDAAKLIELSRRKGLKQNAILAGMGTCRRESIAQTLAALLGKRPKAAMARPIIDALGEIGSAWVWKTPALKHSKSHGEESSIRLLAAKALVKAFVDYKEQELKQAAADALLLVDEKITPRLITSAKRGAKAGIASELDALAQRFSQNPIR